MAEGYYHDETQYSEGVAVGHGILVAILLFIWVKAHATENGIEKIGIFRIFVAILPILGIPIYLYKYYGLKSGSIRLGKTIGLSILLIISYGITSELVHYYKHTDDKHRDSEQL